MMELDLWERADSMLKAWRIYPRFVLPCVAARLMSCFMPHSYFLSSRSSGIEYQAVDLLDKDLFAF